MEDSISVQVGGVEVEFLRARLKAWLRLEEIRTSVLDAAEGGATNGVADSIFAYLSAASGQPATFFTFCPWYEVAQAFMDVEELHQPRVKFPILDTVSKKEQKWDYPQRDWYVWVNLLGRAYGWEMESIAQLEIEDAIGLMQEILTDEQLEREWQWQLSEVAYPYDKATKKNVFKPLQRPPWMVVVKKLKKTRMRKDMLPIGNIVDLSDTGLHGSAVPD